MTGTGYSFSPDDLPQSIVRVYRKPVTFPKSTQISANMTQTAPNACALGQEKA